MGRLDELIRVAGQHAPPAATKGFLLDASLPAEIARARTGGDRTMDRFSGAIEQRGLDRVGSIDDIDWPNDSLGGIAPDTWQKIARGYRDAPKNTQVYVVNPVEAVASQYPESLRQDAIATARGFRVPFDGLSKYGRMRGPDGGPYRHYLQNSLDLDNPQTIVFAYPSRQAVRPGAAGDAWIGARPSAAGQVRVAAGGRITPARFDTTLLHELRHSLEGEYTGWQRSVPPYESLSVPRSAVSISPQTRNYLSRLQEEAARFADGRARYAHKFGRLISGNDEAEDAARMILSNERGLGEGFYPNERAFYRAAREASPEIRDHQNMLLQRLLAVPIGAGVTGAAMSGDE